MGRSEIALPVPTSANYRMSDTFTQMQTFSTIICISLISKHRSENVTKKKQTNKKTNKQKNKQLKLTYSIYQKKISYPVCLFVCFCSVLFCSVLFFSVCFFQFSGSVYIVSYLKSALTSVPHVKKLLIRKC